MTARSRRRHQTRPPRRLPAQTPVDVVTAPVSPIDPALAARRVAVRNPRGRATRREPGERALTELAETLARGRTRRDRSAVQAHIARLLRPRWLDRVITISLTGDKPAQLRLTWTIDTTAPPKPVSPEALSSSTIRSGEGSSRRSARPPCAA